jgi:hypothetical protein
MNIQQQMEDTQQAVLEKLKRWKIDLLLRANATILSQMGIDSTEEEKVFANELRKENLKKIKDIDPDFFDIINDNEA